MFDDVASTPDDGASDAMPACSQMQEVQAQANQFLVRWRDPQTQECMLGELASDKTTHTSKCDLSLGYNSATNAIGLAIHLPLKLRKGLGASDMYLVTAADVIDTLRSESTNNVPPLLRKAGIRAGKEPIHCHFSLRKGPGCVVMPVRTTQKLPSPHARALLSKLRSLSEATEFDIYLDRSRKMEYVIGEFFRILRSGHAQSFNVDWQDVLSGRDFTTNDWKAYGIQDKDVLPVAKKPLVEQPPPSYNEAAQAPCRDGEKAPRATECFQLQDSRSSPKPTNQSIADTQSPSDSKEGEDDESQPPTRPRNEATREECQKNHQAPVATQNGVHSKRDDPQQSRPPKRKADEAHSVRDGSQQSRPPKRKTDEAGCDAQPVAICVSTQISITEGKSIAAITGQFGLDLDTRDHYHFASEILADGLYTTPPSILHPEIHPNRALFTEPQLGCFADALLLLKRAWLMEHSLLCVCATEIQIMCEAIMSESYSLFTESRERCLTKFLEYYGTSSEAGPWKFDHADWPKWIIDFLRQRLGTGADILVLHELVALKRLIDQWNGCGGVTDTAKPGHKGEYDDWEIAVVTQMGACLLVAFCKCSSSQTLGQRD